MWIDSMCDIFVFLFFLSVQRNSKYVELNSLFHRIDLIKKKRHEVLLENVVHNKKQQE